MPKLPQSRRASAQAPGYLALDFGARLKEARIQAGLSQADLAKRLGTHQAYISLVERGHHNPTLAACEKYAKALGRKVILSLVTDDEPGDVIAIYETILAELTRMRGALREPSEKK